MKPTAWKLESAPRTDGTRRVLGCYPTEPTKEQYLIAEVEGDRYVPMIELAETLRLIRAAKLEGRADAARLDWLADPENTVGKVLLPTASVHANLHSLRDEIDAAMLAWGSA